MTIAERILNGEADGSFAEVRAAVKQREQALATVRLASVGPGDRVRFNTAVRPKYLAGAAGTVTKVNGKTVVVDLDQPSRRYHRGIRVPKTLVDTL